MYTVLLVDDEPWELLGLEKSFNWVSNGFHIIEKTTSSSKALDIILTHKPDVVFTDIRMPILNGIDLLKLARNKDIDTEFIIISGFAEFSYAQEALREGAFDYRQKPIQLDESQELLDRLLKRLNDKRLFKDLELYDRIIETNINSSILFSEKGCHPCLPYFQVLYINYSDNTSVVDQLSYFRGKNNFYDFILIFPNFSKAIYVLNTASDIYPSISSWYAEEKNEDLPLIGISRLYDGKAALFPMLREAHLASKNYFLTGYKGVYKNTKVNYKKIKELTKNTLDSILNNDSKMLRNNLDNLPTFFYTENLGVRDFIFFLNQLHILLPNNLHEDFAYSEFDFEEFDFIINSHESFKAFCTEFYNYILYSMSSCQKQDSQTEISKNFNELLNYLTKNYASNISLKQLAQKFYFNESYCCELFKKFTGNTYSQYISDLRLKKACELLKYSRLSIMEIFEQVGYNDYFYFIKVFKKNYGETPSQYRKRIKGSDSICL